MLSLFIEWAKSINLSHTKKGIDFRLSESTKSDNSSARLDIDTPTTVARITFWETGDYHAEIIDITSERILYSNLGTLLEGSAIAKEFAPFFKMLGLDA